ncbi:MULTISPECIES: M24 family metallopeptidase [Kordiimonas]|jgi:Xaa-Pro dipeptidase|uniref:M24 family metallopeptidase n=1 Tax=Kordiimonas TaxID=288021 RepID=UPI00257B1586|nr:Xaa-Pro peptidase family protein [Kordiimonas sp. UBA4487]
MTLSKRDFFKLGAAAGGAALLAGTATSSLRASDSLQPITGDVTPIGVDERKARVAKAQRLMAEHGIDAILLEPGSAMLYFTGISWWRSERLTAVVIPREGEIAVVTPFFEEPSVRESMTFGSDVRTWNEHENPFERVAGILKDRGLKGGKIGLEDTVRYFIVEGLKKAAPGFEITSALDVTLGCRMYKSAHEIALMRKANEVTLTAYSQVWDKLEVGMTPADITAMMRKAQASLGGQGIWGMALLAEASAYPHGSGQPQRLKEGDIVLMDCGCQVHGYQSDISRTFVFGEPTKRQREVWNTVRRGQQIAFETAQVGTPAGAVDDAVRKMYEGLGYGPGYKTPGLSHRTGHGIGMDGHESVNFVHGETTKLAPGMCFSNEPGLYIFGEFGVRLEDCIHMTDAGPAWFTVPPESLDKPIGRMG